MAAENLHVPQSKSGPALNSKSVKDIMDAYKTQAKVSLYDDSSAMGKGADGLEGVVGRNIPLEALRPSAAPVGEVYDEDGNLVRRNMATSRVAQDMEAMKDIASAYNRMNGTEDAEDDEDDGGEEPYRNGRGRAKDLSSVRRFQAEYIEDMPDTDDGLLEVLELAINNARANLEMLESLYAALSAGN